MLNADFPAETANKRPSLVDILSGPAPRSPVRAARFDASPHIILTWAYLRLLKFLLSEAKRLFQQYRPKADIGDQFLLCCTTLLSSNDMLGFGSRPEGKAHETARVHHASWRIGSCVAAPSASAGTAAGDAGNWVSQPLFPWPGRALRSRVPPRPKGVRLHCGAERGDRIWLGGESNRSITSTGGRSRSPQR